MRHKIPAGVAGASLAGILCLWLLPLCLLAQHAVDPANRYFRVVALVHLTGSGKRGDPVRPEYAPTVLDAKRRGIIGWSAQLTDDKKMAIVHMVAVDHHAFDAILADARPEIKVFEIGKTPKAVIEAELGLLKAGFDLGKFQVAAQ